MTILTATMRRVSILLSLVFMHWATAQSQSTPPVDRTQGWTISPSYALQWSAADLGDRFGSSFSAGAEIDRYLSDRWAIGIQGLYEFGGSIRDAADQLAHLRDSEGRIFNGSGSVADVFQRRRGFYGGLRVRRLFRLGADRGPHVHVALGAGYWRHWIRIVDDSRVLRQAQAPYSALYDRQTAGWSLRQAVGYTYLNPGARFNWYFQFELMEGFTHGTRDYVYELEGPDTDMRLDINYGIRVGWLLPVSWSLSSKESEDIYY